MKLENKEMLMVIGGVSLSGVTGSLLSSLSTLLKTIYGFGQNVGSGIRRISTGNLCKF